MNVMRKVASAAVLCSGFLFLAGCGDTYRPIANPVTSSGGLPSSADYIVVANQNVYGANGSVANGATQTQVASQGSATMIDTTGDTNIGNRFLGIGVSSLTFTPSGGLFFATNPVSDTVSAASLTGTGGQVTSVNTAALHSYSNPTSIAVPYISTFTKTYVVQKGSRDGINMTTDSTSNATACPGSGSTGNGSVAAYDMSGLVSTGYVCVGPTPQYAVINSDGQKVYVMDADGKVTVINVNTNAFQASTVTVDKIPVGSNPVFGLISTDANKNYLYVLNQGDASISVIDVNTDTVVNTFLTSGATTAGPTYMALDHYLNRLYVVNTTSNTASVFDLTNAKTPTSLALDIPVGPSPNSVDILVDGSKAYVANSGTNTVSVINGSTFAVTKTLTVSTADGARVNWVSSTSTKPSQTSSTTYRRVYAAITTADDFGNGTVIIDPSLDTILTTIPAPPSCSVDIAGLSCACNSSTTSCTQVKLQRPVFIGKRSFTY